MTTEVLSRREVMAKAFDELENSDEKEETGEEEAPESKTVVPEKKELEAKPEEKSEEEGEPEKKEIVDEADKKEKLAAEKIEGKEEAKPAPVTDRAPQSWKPAVREHWPKLPAEVRAEVNRRELEIQRTLSGTAQVRKFAQDFAGIVQPVAHLIRQQGSTPLAAVHNLFNTAASLMTGSADQKAAIIAEIIGNYNVDIKILDAVLSQQIERGGGRLPSQPNSEGPPAWAQPLFGFMQEVQGVRQQHEQRLIEEADELILTFQDKPYFEDVRADMSDILEMAANRGRKITMDEAYDMAIKLHPEISKIVGQRAAAANSENGSLKKKKGAASTVSGAPSGSNVGANKKPANRREAIEQAWDGNLT